MSPFRQIRTEHFTGGRPIYCPLSKALSVLHDPLFLIDLNPLVVHREQDASASSSWTIRDRLNIVGFRYEFNYTAKVKPLEDGVLFEIAAPMGIVLSSRWFVSAKEEGVVELREEVTVTANFLLMSATLRDLRRAHSAIHQKLLVHLEGSVLRTSPTCPGTPMRPQSTSALHSALRVYIPSFLLAALCYYLLVSSWTRTVLVTVLLVAAPLVGSTMSAKDPYGTFHLALNRANDQDKAPETEWLNMGYWKDTESFPEACEALALKLVEAADCQPNGNVLDVGHGSGDSLLLHLRHASVPRPAHLTGITSLRAHHERALERVQGYECVTLHHGDAVYRPSAETMGKDHPLAPSSDLPPFTSILALDCAYHFRTRHDFLSQSYERLTEGGKVALADICFASDAAGLSLGSSIVRRTVGFLGVMPKENMITIAEYVDGMRQIGYADVQVEDITEYVFPGFRKFLKRQGAGWGVFGSMIRFMASSGARFVVIHGSRHRRRQ